MHRDVLVALVHRGGQQSLQALEVLGILDEWGIERLEGVDYKTTGHLTSGVPAHAICQGQEARAGITGILVVIAHQTPIRAGRIIESQVGAHAVILRSADRISEVWGAWTMGLAFHPDESLANANFLASREFLRLIDALRADKRAIAGIQVF